MLQFEGESVSVFDEDQSHRGNAVNTYGVPLSESSPMARRLASLRWSILSLRWIRFSLDCLEELVEYQYKGLMAVQGRGERAESARGISRIERSSELLPTFPGASREL